MHKLPPHITSKHSAKVGSSVCRKRSAVVEELMGVFDVSCNGQRRGSRRERVLAASSGRTDGRV